MKAKVLAGGLFESIAFDIQSEIRNCKIDSGSLTDLYNLLDKVNNIILTYRLKYLEALQPVAPISEYTVSKGNLHTVYGPGNDNYGRDKSVVAKNASTDYQPMQNNIAGELTEKEKGKVEEPHFADYQEGDEVDEEDDLIGAVAQYRKDHPIEENKSVAQILVDSFIKDIPPILWEMYNKAPDENDIVWAKEKIAEYNLASKETNPVEKHHVKTPENRGIKSEGGERHFDAELIAAEYANQYPDRDYHDLQHAVIYGITVGAQWQQAQSQQGVIDQSYTDFKAGQLSVVKVIEEEIQALLDLKKDYRLRFNFDNYDYAIFILTDLLTKLKTQPK